MKTVSCPVCQSQNHSVLCGHAVDRMHGFPGEFSYVRCNECAHGYLNPRLGSDLLKSFYPDDYGPHRRLKSEPTKRKFSLFYLSPVKRTEQYLEKYIGKDSRVLDVGCGRGDFLADLRSQTGCQCRGVDFSPNAVEVAGDVHGLEVFCGQLVDAPLLDESFDLITMWWYLEHDPHPADTLRMCNKLLKPNGLLIFGVPNYRSFNAKMFGSRWYHLDAPRHVSLFSPKSIRALVEETGFMLQRLEWDRSTWGLLGSLQYAFMANGHKAPFRIPDMLLFRLLSFPLTLLLSFLKCSDIVTVYCRKK